MEDIPAARRGIGWIELEGNGGLRNKSDIFFLLGVCLCVIADALAEKGARCRPTSAS
jgi:hypothetical protein